MSLKTWMAQHDRLVVSSIFIAIVAFAGVSIGLGVTPYVRLVNSLEIDIDNMVIVSREYPFVKENTVSLNSTAIEVEYPVQSVKGIYLQSEYNKEDSRINYLHQFTVLKNEKILDLSCNPEELLLPEDETPVVVEYFRHNWSSVIWAIDLKVNNTSGGLMRVPAANISVGNVGDGWIPSSTDIPKDELGIVRGYLKVNNDRHFHDFLSAILYERSYDLSAEMEAYALIDYVWIKLPCFGLKINLPFDFPIDMSSSSGKGDPPQIFQINRSIVLPNQPVIVNVSAKDKGAGISNRSYVRVSVDNGFSWYNHTLTGPAWDNQTGDGVALGGLYPYNSSRSPQFYQGVIPAQTAGKNVKWKIYLEDYAGNVDHLRPGNWIESAIYSYTVPASGELDPEIISFESLQPNGESPNAPQVAQAEGEEVDDRDFGTKIFDYIESNGVPLMYFLKKSGANLGAIIEDKLDDIVNFLYINNVDAKYFIGNLLSSFDMALDLIADSGLAIGHLVGVLGLNVPQFFKFAVDNLFIPLDQEIKEYSQNASKGVVLVDDIDTNILSRWTNDAGGVLSASTGTILNVNEASVGVASLKWDTPLPSGNEKIISTFDNPLSANKDDYISFWLSYFPLGYSSLNRHLALRLEDGDGTSIISEQLELEQIEKVGEWQEIGLALNATSFPDASSFKWNDIRKIGLDYTGINPQIIYLDYISCFNRTNYFQNIYFNKALALSNTHITQAIESEFTDITALDLAFLPEPVKGSPFVNDWSINSNRTPYYNFMNLIASETGTFDGKEGTNYHTNAGMIVLRDAGAIAPYDTMINMIGGVYFAGHQDPPVTDATFYQYVNSFFMFLICVPLLHNIIRIIKPKKKKGGS